MATSCRLSTVVTSSSMVRALLSSIWREETVTCSWNPSVDPHQEFNEPGSVWMRFRLQTDCAADLGRGDDWLHQEVNEGLIVHWRQDPILHQAHLQTQRSQLTTNNRGNATESKTLHFSLNSFPIMKLAFSFLDRQGKASMTADRKFMC